MIEGIDDINRKKERREREKIKDEIASDVSEVVEDVLNRIEDLLKRKQIEREIIERKKEKWWEYIGKKVFKLSWIIILIIITLDFLLGAFWLLKTLINILI